MNGFRWIAVLFAIALAVAIGALAYNAGLANGIAQSGKIVAPAPGAMPYPYPYPYFGFSPFWIIAIVAFIAVVARAAGHRGHCRYRSLDEWHRQAHERMS